MIVDLTCDCLEKTKCTTGDCLCQESPERAFFNLFRAPDCVTIILSALDFQYVLTSITSYIHEDKLNIPQELNKG